MSPLGYRFAPCSHCRLVAIVPESIYLSDGVGLKTGSGGCVCRIEDEKDHADAQDASAFLITTILFTQHLWTLAIATATFLLLVRRCVKRLTTTHRRNTHFRESRPLWRGGRGCLRRSFGRSRSRTRAVSRHAHECTPLTPVWWGTVGWVSTGNLCYYGSAPIRSANDLDARDLVQFIPRAIVFIVIIALYSRLFSFLRRPDTIQLSSHFASGGVMSDPHKGVAMGRILRRLGGGSSSSPAVKRNIPVDPDAPWEQLEFIQVGSSRPWDGPTQSTRPQFAPSTSYVEGGGILLTSRPVSPKMAPADIGTDTPSSLPRLSLSSSNSSPSSGPLSQRPSETDTLVTPELRYDGTGRPPMERLPSSQRIKVLSPVISGGSVLSSKLGFPANDEPFEGDDVDDDDITPTGDRRASGQTLKEFFQDNQAPGLHEEARGSGSGSSNAKGAVPMSATAYFNRQASLLMLYFPLAVSGP